MFFSYFIIFLNIHLVTYGARGLHFVFLALMLALAHIHMHTCFHSGAVEVFILLGCSTTSLGD